MKKNNFLLKIFLLYFLFITDGLALKANYFDKGKVLFEKKEFDNSRILFERDLVFNPKNEKSYLYLAKIYYKKDNDQEQEMNLKSVLLLNPQNDEAIYMLIILKIKQSNYEEAKNLIEKFNIVCRNFFSKKKEISARFDKLIPENAKDKN